jgi:hypothetical protein
MCRLRFLKKFKNCLHSSYTGQNECILSRNYKALFIVTLPQGERAHQGHRARGYGRMVRACFSRKSSSAAMQARSR